MAVGHIAIHGERHLNPLVEQRLERQPGPNASARENAGNGGVTEDTFTPSNPNNPDQVTAQDAGIFQLSQAAVTANIVLAQPGSNADPAIVPGPSAPGTITSADLAVQAALTALTNNAAVGPQQVSGAPTQLANAAAATTANEQGQIQNLNTALAALGLSRNEILQIDRIAAVIQNFDPSAFSDLVNQFQELARQAQQLISSPTASTPGTAANPLVAAAGTNPPANANAAGGGFQVQSISIQFVGLQEAVNVGGTTSNGKGSGSNNSQVATVNLQIEQVQFTLVNGNGQIAQLPTPQQGANAAPPIPQSPNP